MLSHWCLSCPFPTLNRSEMAGVSRDSSTMPPWPIATPFCCSNPWTTYLYRRGMTQGAHWCPWIHQRSLPSASIRRRVWPLFSVSLTRGSRCQWLNGFLLCFIQILDFVQSCKNHIFSFWALKIVKQILWWSMGWLVFNKNITCTMFSVKNNCYDIILLFQCKFIFLVILLQMLWNFHAMLCVVVVCFGKYVMIFEALYLWYVIYVHNMA